MRTTASNVAMHGRAQFLPRLAELDNNLKEQVLWLSENFEKAYFNGFTYAHTLSKDVLAPVVFNFDNNPRRASNNSTLASLSQIGDFELQSFRLNSSINSSGHNSNNTPAVPARTPSSSTSALSTSVEWRSSESSEDQDLGGSADQNNRRRLTVGSFLSVQGPSKGYQPSSAPSNGYRSDYNSDTHDGNSHQTHDRSSGTIYGNDSGAYNGNKVNSSYDSKSYSSNSSSSSSSSTNGTMQAPNGLYLPPFSMEVSSSQLAALDMESKKSSLHLILSPLIFSNLVSSSHLHSSLCCAFLCFEFLFYLFLLSF